MIGIWNYCMIFLIILSSTTLTPSVLLPSPGSKSLVPLSERTLSRMSSCSCTSWAEQISRIGSNEIGKSTKTVGMQWGIDRNCTSAQVVTVGQFCSRASYTNLVETVPALLKNALPIHFYSTYSSAQHGLPSTVHAYVYRNKCNPHLPSPHLGVWEAGTENKKLSPKHRGLALRIHMIQRVPSWCHVEHVACSWSFMIIHANMQSRQEAWVQTMTELREAFHYCWSA